MEIIITQKELMRIVLNSKVVGEEDRVIVFNKNMEVFKLEEYNNMVDDRTVYGVFQDIQLNKLCMLSHELETKENYVFKVSQDFPLFKLHFQLEGNVTCTTDIKRGDVIEFLKGTYNLIYVPSSNTSYVYSPGRVNSLEIYFAETFLQNNMGYCFTGKSAELTKAKKEQLPYVFLEEGYLINEQILGILKDISNCVFEGTMKKAFLEAKITELLLIALTNKETKVVDELISEFDTVNLTTVENHIKQNLKKELTIPDLSVIAGMNTSKFKKCFKQIYGSTVFKYITALRIEKAKELIQKENYTISQASYEVGYKNPQHFTVAFKKKLGYLPSQLKKGLQQIVGFGLLNDFLIFVIEI
ncbi:AraC-like DNA-binding protein [Wenyingzhuangia heitensis]|uniref:AraC-like DNA-binding protein n=1 Tax=Wenyingzhuangia heitensis TaxID=1487859 RepID=A0ABX0U7H0_9FLAO|nr:AraC family transcriptional regulator [Wenyingzhuangia heitensis]NIJ43690.1 AraC-like DNA-binding protein [Wenyingzhuangia heitensis]